MPDPQERCCILKLCCPDQPGQAKALASFLEDSASGKDESYAGLARVLLDNFDLVPKGVGEAIAKLYGPEFAHVPRKDIVEAGE